MAKGACHSCNGTGKCNRRDPAQADCHDAYGNPYGIHNCHDCNGEAYVECKHNFGVYTEIRDGVPIMMCTYCKQMWFGLPASNTSYDNYQVIRDAIIEGQTNPLREQQAQAIWEWETASKKQES